MSFLPIVERELRVAARLTATYRNRALLTGAVIAVALAMLFLGSFGVRLSILGREIFRVLSVLALIFCLLEGGRKTADCLSEEKREGTLGLLYLTNLKPYDLVLGKLVGMSLSGFFGLIGILPVLGLPLLLGGVMEGEYWRMALALLCILFFSLCVGIFVSSISREQHMAMAGAVALGAVLCGAPLLPGSPLRALSPADAFRTAFETNYWTAQGEYWGSLGLCLSLGLIMLACACIILPRFREEEGRVPTLDNWGRSFLRRFGNPAKRALRRRAMLGANPVMWLAGRQPGARFGLAVCGVVALAAATAFALAPRVISLEVYVVACWVLNTAIKALIAAQACRCNAEARRTNTLEMLLVTPLTSAQFTYGQVEAMMRLVIPASFVILGIEMTGLFIGGSRSPSIAASGDPSVWLVLPGVAYLVLFSCDVAAVTWVGMWFGLTSKKESQAITKTVVYVLLLPYLALLVCWCPGSFFLYLSSVLWIFWARGRLATRFREFATGHPEHSSPVSPLQPVPLPDFARRQPPLPPIQG